MPLTAIAEIVEIECKELDHSAAHLNLLLHKIANLVPTPQKSAALLALKELHKESSSESKVQRTKRKRDTTDKTQYYKRSIIVAKADTKRITLEASNQELIRRTRKSSIPAHFIADFPADHILCKITPLTVSCTIMMQKYLVSHKELISANQIKIVIGKRAERGGRAKPDLMQGWDLNALLKLTMAATSKLFANSQDAEQVIQFALHSRHHILNHIEPETLSTLAVSRSIYAMMQLARLVDDEVDQLVYKEHLCDVVQQRSRQRAEAEAIAPVILEAIKGFVSEAEWVEFSHFGTKEWLKYILKNQQKFGFCGYLAACPKETISAYLHNTEEICSMFAAMDLAILFGCRSVYLRIRAQIWRAMGAKFSPVIGSKNKDQYR